MVQRVGAMLFSVVKTVFCHVENAALFFLFVCFLPGMCSVGYLFLLVKHT